MPGWSSPKSAQMPQALAEVLSQVRLIKEAVMNGDNSRSSGRGSHVLVDIERACEITGRLGQFNDRVKVLRKHPIKDVYLDC